MGHPTAVYRVTSKSSEAFLQATFPNLSTAEEYAQGLNAPGIKFLVESKKADQILNGLILCM